MVNSSQIIAIDSQSSKESVAQTEAYGRMNELTKSYISEPNDLGNL